MNQILQSDICLELIANFCLMDDVYMQKFFEDDVDSTQLLISTIIPNAGIIVEKVVTQANIKNLQGRSMRLDILAHDRSGNSVNIEVQRGYSGASRKRARYHSSVLDANTLLAGESFDQLPETYVIFITENDVLGKGLPLYKIERYIIECGISFDDGAHIIYVNGQCQDDTPLGRLMHDFFCKNPDDMHYQQLADRARYFKCNERGIADMQGIMGKYINEVSVKIRAEGKKEANTETALRMLESGRFTYDDIAFASGLTNDEINALAGQKPA